MSQIIVEFPTRTYPILHAYVTTDPCVVDEPAVICPSAILGGEPQSVTNRFIATLLIYYYY